MPDSGIPTPSSEPTLGGLRLQGYLGRSSSQVGDLQLDPQAVAAGKYRFETDGRILVQSDESGEQVCGQILLQSFDYPHGLAHAVTPAGATTRIVYTELELGLPQPLTPPRHISSGMLELIERDDDPVPVEDDKPLRFRTTGMPHTDFRLEWSADLVTWKVVSVRRTNEYGSDEFVLSAPSIAAVLGWDIAGTGWVSDPFGRVAGMGSRGFYRAVRLP